MFSIRNLAGTLGRPTFGNFVTSQFLWRATRGFSFVWNTAFERCCIEAGAAASAGDPDRGAHLRLVVAAAARPVPRRTLREAP